MIHFSPRLAGKNYGTQLGRASIKILAVISVWLALFNLLARFEDRN